MHMFTNLPKILKIHKGRISLNKMFLTAKIDTIRIPLYYQVTVYLGTIFL